MSAGETSRHVEPCPDAPATYGPGASRPDPRIHVDARADGQESNLPARWRVRSVRARGRLDERRQWLHFFPNGYSFGKISRSRENLAPQLRGILVDFWFVPDSGHHLESLRRPSVRKRSRHFMRKDARRTRPVVFSICSSRQMSCFGKKSDHAITRNCFQKSACARTPETV
jgi:hypothetical protein